MNENQEILRRFSSTMGRVASLLVELGEASDALSMRILELQEGFLEIQELSRASDAESEETA